MNRNKLTELINHPEKVTSRDATMLTDMVAQYPYATILQILLAKSQQGSDKGRHALGTAALYTPHRAILKLVMENQLPALATAAPGSGKAGADSTTPSQSATPPAAPESQQQAAESEESETVSQEFYDELQENLRRLTETRNRSRQESGGQSQPAVSETVQQIMQEHQEQPLENPRVQQQRNLIDSFLQNGAMLPRRQLQEQAAPENPLPDLSQQASFTPPDLATETLAAIMERQGKTEKAIDIYQKLLLKYPQKSAYFADCIERLKKNH